jgi:hypothetical protein
MPLYFAAWQGFSSHSERFTTV